MKRRTLHENPKQRRVKDAAIPPRKVSTRAFRSHLATVLKDGEAVFLMRGSYTYAAIVIPVEFSTWSETEKEQQLAKAQKELDRAIRSLRKPG
jgi:hypothetical protein